MLQRYFARTPDYSSYNAGPMGTKAFYLLLEELGVRTGRAEGSIGSFLQGTDSQKGIAGQPGLVIGFDSSDSDRRDIMDSREEAEALAAWVRDGGSLLWFTAGDSPVTDAMGIRFGGFFPGNEFETETSVFTRDVKKIDCSAGRYMEPGAGTEVLAGDGEGAAVVAGELGSGRVVVVSAPSIITNSRIEKGDNVVLLINIIRVFRPAGVWFHEPEAVASGGKTAAVPRITTADITVFAQAGLALILLFLFWGRRFGRPVPLPVGEEGVSAEYVNTMANIFRQGQAREIALDNIFSGFWQRLTRSFGVPAGISREEMVRLCRQRTGMDSEGLERIFNSVKKIQEKGHLSETGLFTLVRDMEIWRRENLKNAGN